MSNIFKCNIKSIQDYVLVIILFVFSLIDTCLDKSSSKFFQKSCWDNIEKEKFAEKLFFSIIDKMSLTLGIIIYLINKKILKNDLIDKIKNTVSSEETNQLSENLNPKPIQIESKYFSLLSISIIFFFSLLIECYQYFNETNIAFESISYSMFTIFFVGNILFNKIYGKSQLFSMLLCLFVSAGFQIYYAIERDNSKMYLFSLFVNLFIGLKLMFLKYLITTKLFNAFDLFAFEGCMYFIVMIFDLFLIICGNGKFSYLKEKLGNHYISHDGKVNKHTYFYISRNITNFFIHFIYFLLINFSNPNFYICSDIISKGIYYITIRVFLIIDGKKKKDDIPVVCSLINYIIITFASLIFCEILLIKGLKNDKVISKDDLDIIKKNYNQNIIQA